MIKTAIFVEGQTELIFVREMLLKVFQYQDIALECFNLIKDSNLSSTEYPYQNDGATHYFQILNVGNDRSVLSRMLNRESNMLNAGFSKIIGLRDMYSKEYREVVGNAEIDDKVSQHFIDKTQSQIISSAMFFTYSIMEVEAWMLGLSHSLVRIDKRLTNQLILDEIGFDLSEIDPETVFFHPAKVVEKIFLMVGMDYKKSQDNSNMILGSFEREDFINLLNSKKCNSFKEFYGHIFNLNPFLN